MSPCEPARAPVERGVPAPDGYTACDICGAADVLGLGTCVSCVGGDTDALVFVEASERRADRERLEAWLVESLGGRIEADAARDAAGGLRPLVGLPAIAAGRAVRAFSMRGVSAVALSHAEAKKRVPRGLLLLAGAAAGSGLFIGLTASPLMLVLGPAFGVLLILAASRRTREPVWAPAASPLLGLPGRAESCVRRTLAGLPAGRARDRLKDIVAVATALGPRGEAHAADDYVEAAGELLVLSCRAAVDLDRLDRSLEVLGREPTDETDPGLGELVGEAATARQTLVEQLDEVVATLVRAQSVASRDPAELLRAAKRLAGTRKRGGG